MYFDVELTEFSVDWIQHMKGGKKKRDRDNSKVWCLTNWKNGRAIS